MREENKVVNGLWIGDKLTPIELMTIYSFVEQGHLFHLWTYGPLENDLPEGVVLKDANEIIPEEEVYARKKTDPTNNLGVNSFGSPFSDLFRYKLLHLVGGWWVDMDIVCLKPLDFEGDYYFRAHPLIAAMGNVMKCPKDSSLMLKTFEKVNAVCNENTEDWLLPNKILNEFIKELSLEKHIYGNMSNQDVWFEIERLTNQTFKIPEEWYFIHWMNEEWRSRGISKNNFQKGTEIFKLLKKFPIDFHASNHLTQKITWHLTKHVKEWKMNRWYQQIGISK